MAASIHAASFSEMDAEQRVYGAILQTRSPETAPAIADRADCDPQTARKYLNWFTDLGIVTTHDGHPITYQRNEAYFEWRRISTLASNNTFDELRVRLRELTEKVEAFQERYDTDTPETVDAFEASSDDRPIDTVYGELAEWETARTERQRIERARRYQQAASDVLGR